MEKGNFILVLCGILLLSSGFLFGLVFVEFKDSVTMNGIVNVSDDCYNLDIRATAVCLRNYVKPFYKYKITNDWVTLTEEQLKERGGDCKDWSDYYEQLIKEVGYNSKTVSFDTKRSYKHRIAIISSGEGYCILDQQNVVGCFYFAED